PPVTRVRRLSSPPFPAPPDLPSFPTRRSSDLAHPPGLLGGAGRVSGHRGRDPGDGAQRPGQAGDGPPPDAADHGDGEAVHRLPRSEEHTSELQSRFDLVCRLLLEKKKTTI